MNISDRIRKRMTENGLRAVDLVKMTGASKGSISQWLNGMTAPSGKNLIALSKALNCDPNFLLTGKGKSDLNDESNLDTAPIQPRTKRLPVISNVQAGQWSEAFDFYSAGDDVCWEEAPINVSDNAFWLKVVGDSMTAQSGLSVPEGMLILVDPDIAPENGKLVVAKLDGTDEVTFKKLAIDSGKKYLKPLNTEYKQIEINGNCRIVGVVIEAKLKL